APECDVGRPEDLLVEEEIARHRAHERIDADAELAHATRPRIRGDQRSRDIFARIRRYLDHLSLLESQAEVVDAIRGEDEGLGEADVAVDAVVERRGRQLAVRPVRLAGEDRPATPV